MREVASFGNFCCNGDSYVSANILASLIVEMVHTIVNTMTVKIAKAGRIVLPKPVRERFHLREGSRCLVVRTIADITNIRLKNRFSVRLVVYRS